MNIFLMTSVPLVPPWDQGDKNLAYMLTSALPQHRFRVLTARNESVPLGANLDLMPAYRTRNPTLAQKARVYGQLLLRPDADPCAKKGDNTKTSPGRYATDLYHLIYRPLGLSSWLLRRLPEFQRHPVVHTVPATADGRPLSRNLFFADRVVVLSEYGRQAMLRLGVNSVVRIPPGIDVPYWAALQGQQARMKSRLGLEDEPLILFPGHDGAGQGADVMLRALPRIVAQAPRAHVIFACRARTPNDQAREITVRQAIARMGLSRSVHFYNTVADMQVLIGACDLVALPLQTMRDKVDLPTTLLEALAAGKPIVISDLAPMNELVREAPHQIRSPAEVGLAVPPGDADALAQAVVELMLDGTLRSQMGQRGQTKAYDCFDIRRIADQYDKLYQEITERASWREMRQSRFVRFGAKATIPPCEFRTMRYTRLPCTNQDWVFSSWL